MHASNPMSNNNGFKLGLFSINAEGGTAFTKVAHRWRAEWSEIETLAHIADTAGLEFILPIARWKGYGGETNVRGASFETLTHAAALAASDYLFTSLRSFDSAKPHIAEINRLAAEASRKVGVLTTTHVVCRETDAEATRYYDYYASEMADATAVDFHQRKKDAHYGAVDPDAVKLERRRYAGGTGSYPLVGRPERIVDEIVKMHALGFSGATLSFVNFNEELPFFVARVLPLLRQAGLRAEDGVP